MLKMGQHKKEVFGELLGLTDEEMEHLQRERVVW